jgi:hypothetical protein
MTDQNTAPANTGGNTDTGNTSVADDGFIDFDTLAPEAPSTAEGDDFGDDGAAEKAKADEEAEKAKAAEDKAKEEEGKKRLSGAQRAKQQRNALLDQIAERDRKIAELETVQQKPAGGDAGPKTPKEEDFNGDWFAYQRALAAHEAGEAARKAANEVLKSREDGERGEREARAAREQRDAHLERTEKAREVIADFDAVMEGMKSVQVRNPTINEIMSSEQSALIAYHFATNPDDLTAFDAMTPREQAREIGRLEATLKLPEPKRQTSAPPPLSKPKGATTPPDQGAVLNNWLDKKYGKSRVK